MTFNDTSDQILSGGIDNDIKVLTGLQHTQKNFKVIFKISRLDLMDSNQMLRHVGIVIGYLSKQGISLQHFMTATFGGLLLNKKHRWEMMNMESLLSSSSTYKCVDLNMKILTSNPLLYKPKYSIIITHRLLCIPICYTILNTVNNKTIYTIHFIPYFYLLLVDMTKEDNCR